MLSTALQVEFAVLRESLRDPTGPQRSSEDCSRGPARSLEVRAVARFKPQRIINVRSR
jgi:hypothetical protein